MAPEVMCAKNHTIAVDYFALGVMTYEFMNGRVINFNKLKRPYFGKTRKEIKEMIMSKQVQVKKDEIPEGWSIEGADFINRVVIYIYKSFYNENQVKGSVYVEQ